MIQDNVRSLTGQYNCAGDPEIQVFEGGRVNETINYNERFSWNNEGFALGRLGFGPLGSYQKDDFDKYKLKQY